MDREKWKCMYEHIHSWYAYISALAEWNPPIFVGIGFVNLLEIYQQVSPTINNNLGMDSERWKWMYFAFLSLILEQKVGAKINNADVPLISSTNMTVPLLLKAYK